MKLENKSSAALDPSVQSKKASSDCAHQSDKASSSIICPQNIGMCKPETQNALTSKLSEKPVLQQVSVMSRPSSAPLIPGHRAAAPVVSMVQTAPLLARSVSATGRLGPDASPVNHSYAPLSYRNAIVGNPVGSSSGGLTHANSPSLGVHLSSAHTQQPALVSSSMFLLPSSDRVDLTSAQSHFPFGMATPNVLQNGAQRMESSQGVVTDEFPHIDIINDLLDDEHSIGKVAEANSVFQSINNAPHFLNRQCSFPGEVGSISGELVSSTSSSCRFERARSYRDSGFQRSYSSLGTHFDTPREYIPQAGPLPYANGHADGLIPSHWQVAGSDLSLVGLRSTEGDGSPYFSPDFSNLACGNNGYTVFRPSNGH